MFSSNTNPEGSNLNWLDCRLTELSIFSSPLQIYYKLKEDRLKLIKEQINNLGVYYFINLLNGHCYIVLQKIFINVW